MSAFPVHPDLDLDESGCLYDRRIREVLGSIAGPDAARRFEALSAMRWLSKLTHQYMERWVEQHGLSEGRLQILIRLRYYGDIPLGELADEMHVTPRNVTGLVDHLERHGLVERIPDQADRRSIRARLTPTGRELVDRLSRESVDRALALSEGIPQEQLDLLRHICLLMVRRIESYGPEPARHEERSPVPS
jgi:DNA-binding MarR family transcriptional regulator